jgi:hypothetical protein
VKSPDDQPVTVPFECSRRLHSDLGAGSIMDHVGLAKGEVPMARSSLRKKFVSHP